MIAWIDKNKDGVMNYGGPGKPFEGKLNFKGTDKFPERIVLNNISSNQNEIYVDRDIMVLATKSFYSWIAQLGNALVAAGGLAAALSTAAGLLLVISSAISHDVIRELSLRRFLIERNCFYKN